MRVVQPARNPDCSLVADFDPKNKENNHEKFQHKFSTNCIRKTITCITDSLLARTIIKNRGVVKVVKKVMGINFHFFSLGTIR